MPIRMCSRLSAAAFLALSGAGGSTAAVGQVAPQSFSGIPLQVVPLFPEIGAPSFTTPTGTGTNVGFNGGSSSGGGPVGTVGGPTGGATSAVGNASSVSYTNSDGTTTTLSGGSPAWRNNNPGNIIYGPFAQSAGAVGQNNGFAVFPDTATGTAALASLLQTPRYQGLAVNEAIALYAPPSQNNTSAYQSFVTNTVGVSGSTPLSSLTAAQMQTLQGAIQRVEGYTPGTISHS